MNFLIFALTYPFIWLLSRLPMRVLYLKSDISFFLLYYIVGYRKKVVLSNLKTAFPKKTNQELKAISKKFFKHFTDLIFESIKSFSISEKEIRKRYVYKNIEIFKELEKKNKSIVLMGSHYANWEWIICLNKFINFHPYGAYTKLQNPYFENKIKKSRTKFGAIFIKTKMITKTVEANKKAGRNSLYGLLSDQSPQLHKTHYWANFLGAKVPVITGSEMLAKKHDLIVLNYSATKIKRGYFEIEFELITDNAKEFKDYEITDKYLQITEKHIRKQPEFYLWSHNRFKHKNKYDEWLKKQPKTKLQTNS